MIYFKPDKKLFVLQTKNTTYSFCVMNERLRSVYFGKKIEKVTDLPAIKTYVNDNWCRHCGINTHRYKNEFEGWGSRFYSYETLKVTFDDGVRDLDLVYFNHVIAGDKLIVTLCDKTYKIEVDCIYTVYYDVDIVDRNCVVRNVGEERITINNIASATLQLPYGREYYITGMGSAWTHEYELHRSKITQSATVSESRTGYSNNVNAPYFAIDYGKTDENNGEVWFGTLQWSGNWKISAVQDTIREVSVTAGINDFDFSYVLNEGESFQAPILSCGYTDKGFGQASRNLHDYQRYITKAIYWKDKPLPVIYNSWLAFEMDITEDLACNLTEKAAEIGAELFVIDDGWFKGRNSTASSLGDWEPDPIKFPNGLNKIIKAVNDKGMKFGLWLEPEMVSPDSDLYRTHPDWIINFPTREREVSRRQLTLNLAREDVLEFCISTIDNLLGKYNIEYLKIDMNRPISQPGWPEEKIENQQKLWVIYVKNFYKLLDYINKKYPNVLIENCASGGGRADLSMTKWCPRVNRSDNVDALDMLYLHEGFTKINLPRSAGGEISCDGYGINERKCPLKFKAHAAMLGNLGISVDLNNISDDEFNSIKAFVKQYKELRNTIQFGDFYCLHSIKDSPFAAYEYVSKDKKEAVLFLFGPSLTFRYVYPFIKLLGLNPEFTYEYMDGKNKTGYGLETVGIEPEAHTIGTLGSKIIVFRAIS